MSVDFHVDDSAFRAVLARAPQATAATVGAAMREHGLWQWGETTSRRLSGAGPASLGRRTGALAGSFRWVPLAARGTDLGDLGISWRIGTRYGRAHEAPPLGSAGSPIRPLGHPYLAIPLSPVLTAAGVARYRSPRQQPGLFFYRSRSGKPFLAKLVKGAGSRRGAGGKFVRTSGRVEVQWALRHEVRLPARLNLALDVRAGLERLRGRLGDAISAAWSMLGFGR